MPAFRRAFLTDATIGAGIERIARARWAAVALTCAALACSLVAAAANDEPLPLGDVPLLLVDDGGVATRSGLVRTIHPARTRNEPVLQADQPWEGERVYTYGSLHFDAPRGLFLLWYMSRSQVPGPPPAPQLRSGGQDVVLHATSHDGIHWEKPALGLHEYRGSKANNIVADFHSPSVVWDRFEADPAKRYKMLAYHRGKYFASFSADGLRWIAFPKADVFAGNDTMTLTQNPRTGEFMAYFKKNSADVPGRVVWLTRSRDFQAWSEPVLVFHADAEDDRWRVSPEQGTEVYNMSVIPHAAGFVGLPAMFRVMSRADKSVKLPPGQSGHDGPIDIQLVTSSDGATWMRSYPRQPIIPRGAPGTFDGGALLGVSSTAVHNGDSTWVLYTALNTGHGGSIPPKRLSIGRADWRLHGFASLDAGPMGGRLETRLVVLKSGTLLINADARRGSVRVAVLERDGAAIAGLGLDDALPLTSDATRHVAQWRSNSVPPTDRPVRILIEMKSSRLYSLATAMPLPAR